MRKVRFSSCKAQTGVLNVIVLIIVLISFVFISYFSKWIFNEMEPGMDEELTHSEAIAMKNDVQSRYPGFIDGLASFIFFGLWIFVIAGSYFFDEHPLLFGLSSVLMIFVLIAGMILGNFYEEMFNSDYQTLKDEFPITNWIMSNQLILLIGVIMSSLIAMYAKIRQ